MILIAVAGLQVMLRSEEDDEEEEANLVVETLMQMEDIKLE